MKNNKGITLIALVITIIVLLILAAVSLALLSGNNGVVTQGTDARDTTEKNEIAGKIDLILESFKTEIMSTKTISENNWKTVASTLKTTDSNLRFASASKGTDGSVSYTANTLPSDYTGACSAADNEYFYIEAAKITDSSSGETEYVYDTNTNILTITYFYENTDDSISEIQGSMYVKSSGDHTRGEIVKSKVIKTYTES